MTCEAITALGLRCRNDSRYGVLCGTHYGMAERDISRLTTGVVNGRTIAIAGRMERHGIPVDMPSGQAGKLMREYGYGIADKHVRDAIMFRREMASA